MDRLFGLRYIFKEKELLQKFALLASISTVLSASLDTSYLFPFYFVFFREKMEGIRVFFNTIIMILSNEQNYFVCRYVRVLIL